MSRAPSTRSCSQQQHHRVARGPKWCGNIRIAPIVAPVPRRVGWSIRCDAHHHRRLHSDQLAADTSVVESGACAHHRTRHLARSLYHSHARACIPDVRAADLSPAARIARSSCAPCTCPYFLVRLHRRLELVLLLDERLEGRARAHLCHVDGSCAGARGRAPSGACAWGARAPGCGRRTCR